MHSVKAVQTLSIVNFNPPLNDVIVQRAIEEVLVLTDEGYKVYTAERTRTLHNAGGWTRQISELVDAPHKLLKELNLA